MHPTDSLEPVALVMKTSDGKCGERYLTASETFQLSQAISLKRIADALSADGASFLSNLAATLADASHDHAQRMS
jgi:hypothetical protein